jgi:3-oxoacyl-[acyl-carrier protein] reductase
MDLRGKVAVVTGASNGIGRVIAIALASKGAKVALTGRNLSGLLITESTIKKMAASQKPSWLT